MPQEPMTFQQQFPQLFQQALALQQGKRCDDAIGKYKILLDQGRNHITNEQASVVYHNMAACAYEKSDLVSAFIWSKKAVTLDSSNSFAQQLSLEVSKKFQPVQVPHQISMVESLQKVGLKSVSFDILLIGTLFFAVVFIFVSLRILLNQKRNRLESETLSARKKQPLAPWIGVIAAALITSLFLFLSVTKWNDISVPKAMIAVDHTPVQTASGGNQATIYEAAAGLEVDVLKTEADFVQVRYPGAFSGWVPKKNLEVLTSPVWP